LSPQATKENGHQRSTASRATTKREGLVVSKFVSMDLVANLNRRGPMGLGTIKPSPSARGGSYDFSITIAHFAT